MSLDEVSRLLDALDIGSVLTVEWRGAVLDRLLDEGHAALGSACADLLRSLGWEVLAEVTFSVYGERGSIDLLAWHAASRTLLVIEIKTEIASAEEMLRRHDVKVRLGPRIVRERLGVAPSVVARLLVVADSSANRAKVVRLESLLASPYPMRGAALRSWLANPAGPMGGLLFLNTANAGGKKLRPKRVRTNHVSDTARSGGTARNAS